MIFLFMLKALLFTYLYYLGSKIVTTFAILAMFNYYLHNNFPDEMHDIREQFVSLFEPHIKTVESIVGTISYNAVYIFSYVQLQFKQLYNYLHIDFIFNFITQILYPPFLYLQLFDIFGRPFESIELLANTITPCENGVKIPCRFFKFNISIAEMGYFNFMYNQKVYSARLDHKTIQDINNHTFKFYKNEFTIQFSKVRFLSVQLKYKNESINMSLDNSFMSNASYYIVGNKLDHKFVTYCLTSAHNICEPIMEYKIHIVDQNANVFQIDQTQTLTFTLDDYTLTKNNEEKKDNEEKKQRTVSEDDDSVNFVKINEDDIIQVK